MITKKNLIVAKSDIANKMAPTDWGEFPTIEKAEVFGRAHIKSTPWAVANESILKDGDNGDVKISYNLLTDIVNPRYTED